MADLMTGSSSWATGSQDSATTLHNLVDEKKAEHINGPAAAIVAMQAKLGSAGALVGTKADLATRLNVGILSSGRLTSAEAGDICMSGRRSKSGWLLCDGAAYSRSTYSELWGAIQDKFGAGDGSTTFNVPNFCGRSPMGTGTGSGGGATGTGAVSGGDALPEVTLGSWKGENTHLLTGNESGTSAHAHSITTAGDGAGAGDYVASIYDGAPPDSTITQDTSPANALQAHNTIHPILGINFFIKT